MSDLHFTLGALSLHPIKSCAGIEVREALLVETGLELDRTWMVVDRDGEMLTQREHPRLALIRPTLRLNDVVLKAPGMLALHLSLDAVETRTRVRIWGDIVKAYEMGSLAAQWFSDFLGQRVELVRFDPEDRRQADRRWTGVVDAGAAFADGFPLLVTSTASLAELNRRLVEKGQAPVTMQRFRPNIVIDGVEAFDEDHIDELQFDTAQGRVTIKLVKPCVRCSIPNVDPASGEVDSEPGATLAGFRSDPRMDGGITFGMNGIVVEGVDAILRVGQAGRASLSI